MRREIWDLLQDRILLFQHQQLENRAQTMQNGQKCRTQVVGDQRKINLKPLLRNQYQHLDFSDDSTKQEDFDVRKI